MTSTPIARTLIGGAAPVLDATASGTAVGFSPGPNVATPTPEQPYTASSALISFDHQALANPMTWWVLPPYSGPAIVGLNFAWADGAIIGNRPFLVGLDDVGDLQQTFATTAGAGSAFNSPTGPERRPSGPTFFLRNFLPDGFNIVQPAYLEPSPGHVFEPRLFVPARRVLLWVYGNGIGPQVTGDATARVDVTGGIYAMGAGA